MRTTATLGFTAALTMAAAATAQNDVQVPVDPAHARIGTVFYVHQIDRNQATFESEAPGESFTGSTNEIHGYFVFDPETPSKGVRGEFRVPVASIDTGIPLRNEHMRGDQWLNADANPFIKFVVNDSKGMRQVKSTEAFRTFQVTMIGDFTVNGVPNQREIDVKFTYLPESQATRKTLPGDLVSIQSDFRVPLAPHEIAGFSGIIGSRVSEQVDVSVRIFASDQRPG